MSTESHRKLLFVHGGWEGHKPDESAAIVRPLLEDAGFDVTVETTLEVYADCDYLKSHAAIVHNWSMGEILPDEFRGLIDAVESGVGLAGWHGGIVDSFRLTSEYTHLVGGQFVAHPYDIVDFTVNITSNHPVVHGVEDFTISTEQYWVATDSMIDVHATTTIPSHPGDPWKIPVTSPAVWTREWGKGRIFVSTLGHAPEELLLPPVQQLLVQGIKWAAHHDTLSI